MNRWHRFKKFKRIWRRTALLNLLFLLAAIPVYFVFSLIAAQVIIVLSMLWTLSIPCSSMKVNRDKRLWAARQAYFAILLIVSTICLISNLYK